MTASEVANTIRACWDPASPRAGQLILRPETVWHYAVTLSDSHAVSWGPVMLRRWHALGQLEVHALEDAFSTAVDVPYLAKPQIYANLLASVPAFHQIWHYGVHGWNCEHWARLVVSGDPISYQVAQTLWGVLDIFGVLHRHRTAKRHLDYHVANLRLVPPVTPNQSLAEKKITKMKVESN
jgi:hypothetical protein